MFIVQNRDAWKLVLKGPAWAVQPVVWGGGRGKERET